MWNAELGVRSEERGVRNADSCHCERGTSVAIHCWQKWIATSLRKAPLLAMTTVGLLGFAARNDNCRSSLAMTIMKLCDYPHFGRFINQ